VGGSLVLRLRLRNNTWVDDVCVLMPNRMILRTVKGRVRSANRTGNRIDRIIS
jgi:hypothetical protein